MNESIINTAPLKAFQVELEKISERYHKEHRDEVVEHMQQTEKLLQEELKHSLKCLEQTPQFAKWLGPVREQTYHYLQKMHWVAWGNCELAPALGIPPNKVFVQSIIVYLSARLIDDGIDGHDNYKGLVDSLYGLLQPKLGDREAAGLSSMMGSFLYHNAMRQLMQMNRFDLVEKLTDLYGKAVMGALSESQVEDKTSLVAYEKIVLYKSVSYDLILHEIFLDPMEEELKTALLNWLRKFSKVAQWLNDFKDEEEDLERGQLNILQTRGMSHYRLFHKILLELNELWQQTDGFPDSLQGALARRLNDSIKILFDQLQFTKQETV